MSTLNAQRGEIVPATSAPGILDRATKSKIDAVEGWLTDREAAFLYHAARTCTLVGGIVEIGSFKGKSTVCLGLGSTAGTRLPIYAIDPHDTEIQAVHNAGASSLPVFERNIAEAGVAHLVTQIPEYSGDVGRNWIRPIAFLWIDGDHSYEGALRDTVLFAPWVVDGGIVAFHDATQGALPQVVRRVFGDAHYSRLGIVDSIVYATKSAVARKSLRDVLVLAALSQYGRARTLARALHLRDLFKRGLRLLR